MGRSPTSATDRNRSGLSSVTILLTLSEWHCMTLAHECQLESSASGSKADAGREPWTSKTRTWLSPAAVALFQVDDSAESMKGMDVHSRRVRQQLNAKDVGLMASLDGTATLERIFL